MKNQASTDLCAIYGEKKLTLLDGAAVGINSVSECPKVLVCTDTSCSSRQHGRTDRLTYVGSVI